jgi:hypothetical protein
MHDIKDLMTPAAPRSLMRARCIWEDGAWRLSRRDSEVYSVQIASSGAWGRCRLLNAYGRTLWSMPSTFTGSFWLSGAAAGGIIFEIDSSRIAPIIIINWREPDRKVV